MPNWKKVVVSGSDAALNSLNVTTAFTASGNIYPTDLGIDRQVLKTDGLGNVTFGYPEEIVAIVKNVSGGTILKGTPVHSTQSGAMGNVVGIIPASASDASTMPATFVLNETLADEAEGEALAAGFIQGVNTSGFEVGQIVYVGESGGYTNVKPTGSNLIQNLGIVTKIGATNGSGYVLGAGRSNDVPNIPAGYAWIGNASQVATPTPTSSIQNVVSASYASTASYVTVGVGGIYGGNGTVPLNTTASINGDFTFLGLDEDTRLIVRDGNNGGQLQLFSDGALGQSALEYYNPAGTSLLHKIQIAGGDTRYQSNQRDLVFSTSTSSLSSGIFITAGNGNVGIGTVTPNYKLDVNGTTNINGNTTITGSVNVINGNVNITSNANFFQGVSTIGSNVSLIGVNSSDQIYIGNQGYDNIIADDTTISGSLEVTNSSKSSLFLNKQILTQDQTIPSTDNGMLTGPISVSESINLTIELSSTLVIL